METNQKRAAFAAWKEEKSEENLWNCILAFQNYPFYTASGLPFRYTVKRGRRGDYTKELLVDRQAASKSLVYSSIRQAFFSALSKQGEIIEKPKALGDIRGISYIYPLFYAFGLILVPERLQNTMVKITEISEEQTEQEAGE